MHIITTIAAPGNIIRVFMGLFPSGNCLAVH
jgi:hypothetical protein